MKNCKICDKKVAVNEDGLCMSCTGINILKKNEIKIVEPHRKIARAVTLDDMDKVLEVASAMRHWMNGKYACVGLAHLQVDDNDPMRFFVALEEPNRIILNPRIMTRSGVTSPSKEGCMTFPNKEHVWKDRNVAITVEYQVFKGKKMVTKNKLITGFLAKVYQHEIDHLNGVYCYDNL